MSRPITRDNLEALLDARQIEIKAANGRWYRIRRNGQTKRWKRNPERFYLPIKWAFGNTGQLSESDMFVIDGVNQLRPSEFRIAPEA